MQPKAIKHYLSLRCDHWAGHTIVEAYAETNQTSEHRKFAVERSENEHERKRSSDEIGVQESVGFLVERITEFIVSLQYTKSGKDQPKKPNDAKNTKRDDH